MKEMDPIVALQAVVDKHGTQLAAAISLQISSAYLSDLLNGRRDFSDAMLDKLGLARKVVKA